MKTKNNTIIYAIGILAGLLASIAFLPQVFISFIKGVKSPIPVITIIIAILAQILWLLYGILNKDIIIIIFSSLTSIIYILLFSSKFIFSNNENCKNYSIPWINY
jgi:uncharacterized protein with PQ loop repeat